MKLIFVTLSLLVTIPLGSAFADMISDQKSIVNLRNFQNIEREMGARKFDLPEYSGIQPGYTDGLFRAAPIDCRKKSHQRVSPTTKSASATPS